MKKVFNFSLLTLVLCLAMGVTGCKNFLQSESFVEALEATIDYLQSGYADVTISSTASETEYISPAAGNYTKDYRKSDKIKLSFVPNEKYVFVKWSATPEESITFEDATSLDTTATVEAVENPITITPVVVPKGVLRVTFKADQGSIIPAEDHDYYLDDEFTIRYTEAADYAFTGWNAYDASGNDISAYLQIESTSALETSCKVLKTDSKITVEATSAKRPKVMAMSPVYDETGANRDSNIKFIFTQTMSQDSIYWTADELSSMGIETAWYGSYKVDSTIAGNKDLYYAYKSDGDTAKLTYKNITVKNRSTGANLISHFGCPTFSDTEKTILVYPCLGEGLAAGIDVEVTLSSEFTNEIGITVASEYSGCYTTSDKIDQEPPIINLEKVKIQGTVLKKTNASKFLSMEEIATTYAYDKTDNLFWLNNLPWSSVPYIQPENGKIKLSLEGYIKDANSVPESAEIIIEPYVTFIDQKSKNLLTVRKSFFTTPNTEDGKTYSFETANSNNPYELEMNWGSEYPSGGYRITVKAYDSKENEAVAYWPFMYNAGDVGNTTLQSSDFTCPDYVIKLDKIDSDNYKDFTVSYTKTNVCYAVKAKETTTDYYPSYTTLNMYETLGSDWCNETYGKNNETLMFYAKDIFGNVLKAGENSYTTKEIVNGDYPTIKHASFDKSTKILTLDISEKCSDITNIVLFAISEESKSGNFYEAPAAVTNCNAKSEPETKFTNLIQNDNSSITRYCGVQYKIEAASKDGSYTIKFRTDCSGSFILYLGIEDRNGYIQIFVPDYGDEDKKLKTTQSGNVSFRSILHN